MVSNITGLCGTSTLQPGANAGALSLSARVMSAPASKHTLGPRADDPPSTPAVLWGYAEPVLEFICGCAVPVTMVNKAVTNTVTLPATVGPVCCWLPR